VSRETADLSRVAIDQAADRLEQQMRRVKERRTNSRKGDRSRAADGIAPPEPALEDEFGNGVSPGPLED
jgi:hypothetical protein